MAKILNFEDIMKTIVTIVNFLRAHALNHREFKEFLESIECEWGDVLFHAEVRWLSRGKVLVRFLQLRNEIKTFLEAKNKVFSELNDPIWIWKAGILCDLMSHLNELNIRLQGKMKIISNTYADVNVFKQKLMLFKQQVAERNFTHLTMCSSLFSEPNLHDVFPRDFFFNCIELLEQQLEFRFQDFKNLEKDISLFQNPFEFLVNEASPCLQMELIELQNNEAAKISFRLNCNNLLEFYSHLPSDQFKNMKDFAKKLLVIFSSTYLCESTFSTLKYLKNKYRNRLTDSHLEHILKISLCSSPSQIDFNKLANSVQSQGSH